MRITVPGFSGVNRITAPQRLEDHQATAAIDCDFRSGDLRSFLGDQATGQALGGSVSSGTLFQFDPTHLIAAGAKDYSFARSPTFYAESVTSDPRTVITEPNQAPRWVTAADLTAAGTGLYTVNATLKRVGVPRPARLPTPKFDLQTGAIVSYKISTIENAAITIPTADAAAAKIASGDKFLIDAPGFDTAAYTASAVAARTGAPTSTDITFRNAKRSWKTVQIWAVKGTNNLRIKLPNHGFADGDQLFFSHIRYGAATNLPNSNMPGTQNEDDVASPVNMAYVWRVVEATYDTFQLEYFYNSTWTLWTRDAVWNDADIQYRQNKKVALLARADNPFPDNAMPSVNIGFLQGNIYHADITYSVDATKVSATWTNANTADVLTTRAYLATFVNSYGDESAPSDATDTFEVAPKDTVIYKANTLPTTSFDETNYPVAAFLPVTAIRLYRTDATGQFRFLKEIAVGDLGIDFVDDKADAELGEPLSTTDWLPPPDKLQGVVNAPGGTVVGFQGKTVCPSVPYAPYAYPLAYRTACDYDIVGLVPTAAGIAVLTQGLPYLLTGTDPASWAAVKLEAQQACVARRSIVDMGDYGMYASPDGLVAINGATVELVTREVMTRDQWQEYNPSTIVAAQTEGRYIATYVPLAGGSRKGFLYDPRTQTFTDLALASGTYVAMYNDLLTDTLLILNSNGTISQWNRGTSYTPYTWASKWFQLPIQELMGVAQILVTASVVGDRTLTFKLYGFDNNTVTELYVASTTGSPAVIQGNRPFRLPYVAPGRFTAFRIILEGTLPVGMVSVARTMDELKEV